MKMMLLGVKAEALTDGLQAEIARLAPNYRSLVTQADDEALAAADEIEIAAGRGPRVARPWRSCCTARDCAGISNEGPEMTG
jgi:hypothetical protein